MQGCNANASYYAGTKVDLPIETSINMYSTIQTPDAAVCHLFLYCCFKDGQIKEEELDNVAGKFTALNMHKELNFKEEMISFRNNQLQISNEEEYLRKLISAINPTNEAALFSYCVELMLSDELLDNSEEQLLVKIAEILSIDDAERRAIKKLMVQRKVVSTQKFF